MNQINNEDNNLHANESSPNSADNHTDIISNNDSPGHNPPLSDAQPCDKLKHHGFHNVPKEMYSPGICVNQPSSNTRNDAIDQKKSSRNGLIRAIALVIVCAVFSAVSAYFVIEFRLSRGDFYEPAQVLFGATIADEYNDYTDEYNNYSVATPVTTPVATISDIMSAEDIFDMAHSQVVVINADAPSPFGDNGATVPVSGSGFVISDDGYILTNYHVIELAHTNNLPIKVVLYDGTSFEAEVVGFEARNDVALIRIDATGLSPVHIGNSDDIRVGQAVYAIGNPFGDLVYTMTDGIVSALDRVVSVDEKSINTFQFSAAVNQGNSGGPVFNARGEVIGIVTAKVGLGNVEGIGFAIPINDAVDIAIELIEHGHLTGRPLLGIVGQTVSSANAAYFEWVEGVLIRDVTPESAADTAGIEVGDIIIALDNEEVVSMELLAFVLRNHRAGETTPITIWRQGETLELTITFDEDMYAGRPEPRPPIDEDALPDLFENRQP